jgi:hypothetical protein
MKRILVLILVSVFIIGGAFAQELVEEVQDAYEAFADDLAPAVPSAAVLGSSWSDAYIGQFPHFGAGLYVGAAAMPIESFETLLAAVDPGASLPAEVAQLGAVPLPVLGLDARLGGFVLPFDIGVKFGFIPEDFQLTGVNLDYKSFGVDVRYALLKGKGLIPKLSIGAGYNYLASTVGMTGLLGGDQVLIADPGTGYDVIVTDPDFTMSYSSSVIDLRLQASTKLLFLNPYLGLGASWSSSKIGGGLSTSVTDGTTALSQAEIDAALAAAGITDLAISADGFTSENQVSAFTYRAYGGLAFSLLFLKVDAGISYNLVTQNLAGQVGLRVQF